MQSEQSGEGTHSDWEQVGDEIIVSVTRTAENRDLDGNATEVPEQLAEVRVPADADLALELSNALRDFYCEEQSAGPPGQKPVHQQYADMEPTR